MEDIHWTKVFTSIDRIESEIVKSALENQGIPVVAVNRQDSAYVVLGEIELMVPNERAAEALLFLKENDLKK